MADNTVLSTGAGGDTIATDDIAGVKYPRSKLIHGADGTNAGDVSTANPLPTHPYPVTSGGESNAHIVAAASTNAQNIKSSAGHLYRVNIFNNAGYPVFVKFHNTAGTPTAGSGVVFTVGCQAGLSRDVVIPFGLPFATGIGLTMVKDLADAGTTVTVANDAVVEIGYK